MRLSWRHAALAAVIIAASVAGFVVVHRSTARSARRDADNHAQLLAVQIGSSVTRSVAYVETMRGLITGHQHITQRAFGDFAAGTLGNVDLHQVAWVERVPAARRAAYEHELGRPIIERTGGRAAARAGPRPVYYPARFVTDPLPDVGPGIDFGMVEGLRAVLGSSEPLFGVTVAPPVRPRGEREGFYFVVAAPRPVGAATAPGFVVLFVPTEWLEGSLTGSKGGVAIRVAGRTAGRVSDARGTTSRSFTAAARRWEVVVPGPRAARTAAALPWSILAAGLALAGLTLVLGLGTAARQRAREELDRHFDLSRDLICTAGFDGHFKRINPSFQRTLGYPEEELLAQPFIEFVHEDDRERTRAEAAALSTGRETVAFQNRYRCADGTIRWLEWTCVGIPSEQLIYAVARDVSERKRAEEERALLEAELRQSQKLEAIGRLAGGVAHDFNNLLTAIIGYSDLILEEPAGAALHEDVLEIRKAAEQAESLTRHLLAFSRSRAVAPTALDVNEVVADMDRLLRRLIGADVELVTVLEPDLPRVDGDPGQLEQIVVNLAVNARDAMPEGGRLVIETASVRLDAEDAHHPVAPGDYVVLTFRDTGVGMDAETQARIFEPFFTTKEVGQGTGLGLSSIWGTVEQAGGRVFVQSAPGEGTTFTIYLPESREGGPAPADPAWAEGGSLRGSERVLLVEDNELIRRLIARTLGEYGYDVVEARYASDALARWQSDERGFDVVVSDVVMPGTSGVELTEQLLAERPTVAVVLMSGYADDAALAGLRRQTVTFIKKPFAAAALLRAVREALARAELTTRA